MPHYKISLAQPMTIKTDSFEEALAIARRTAPHCEFNGYEFTPDENGDEPTTQGERDKITARLQDVTAEPNSQPARIEQLAMAIEGKSPEEWLAMSPDDRNTAYLRVRQGLLVCGFGLTT